MFWPDPKPNRIVGVQYRTNGGCAGGLGGQEWNSYFGSGPAHIILDLPSLHQVLQVGQVEAE